MEGVSGRRNWTEKVEDLVDEGEIDKAISLLETVIEKEQEEQAVYSSSSGELGSALLDLAKLFSSKGLSLKADQTRLRAFQINQQFQSGELQAKEGLNVIKDSTCDGLSEIRTSNVKASTCGRITEDDYEQDSSSSQKDTILKQEDCSDDDWEAAADRAPAELLSPLSLSGVSTLSLEDTQVEGKKRRGRGTFSYRKHGLYSDEQSDEPVISDAEERPDCRSPGRENKTKDLIYGTRHVLVLADFPPSTTTTDLEKLLEGFKDRGAVIRWLNDTTALAVFRSPSIALEASMCIKCPFTVRVLDETDELLTSVPPRDLEPPHPRPKTSARTAQRLIAQSMGVKLSSTSFGSGELRKQEAARRNRIVSRQHMRDDAWGDDGN